LQDGEVTVRLTAAESLADLGHHPPALVSLLVKTLETDRDLRVKAIELLGQIGPPARAALPKLRALRDDEEPDVREAAGKAVKKLEAKGRADRPGTPGRNPEETSQGARSWWPYGLALAAAVVVVVAGGLFWRTRSRELHG